MHGVALPEQARRRLIEEFVTEDSFEGSGRKLLQSEALFMQTHSELGAQHARLPRQQHQTLSSYIHVAVMFHQIPL